MNKQSKKIQKIQVSELQGNRVENGAVEFTYPSGDTDWPGLFLRGDECLYLSMHIYLLLQQLEEMDKGFQLKMAVSHLRSLCDTIEKNVILNNGIDDEDTGCDSSIAGNGTVSPGD